MHSIEPKLLSVLREGYSRHQFRHDLTAGIVVGIVALPLAIAFAIASGVGPEQGLYTAVIAGFLISVLSGSRVQIGGPTGAFIVLVYEIVHRFGYDGLAVATLMAGVLLIVMGFARLGTVIQYIPYPVTVGFTAGIAVVIMTGQIHEAFGFEMASVPADFFPKWMAYLKAAGTVNIWALALTCVTILILIITPRLAPRVPGSMVALVTLTAAVAVFHLPVETIASRYGSIPKGMPVPHIPHVNSAMLKNLVSPAVSIALLAAIESLLSAVVADGMTGRRHRSNAELIAQGAANLASALFRGIPATGAIARTATNIKNGGQTPFAGIIHALTLLVILLAAGRWVAYVPMPVLAGILFVVAYNMSELHLFGRILRSTTRSDALVLLSTFMLTVLVDLTVAIQVGVALAGLLFMRRMSEVANVRALQPGEDEEDAMGSADAAALQSIPAGVQVYEVNGPFFFGAAHKFASALSQIDQKPHVIILRTRNVLMLDATGLRVLETLQKEAEHGGPVLVISGIHAQPLQLLMRSPLYERLGKMNLVPDLNAALERAREIITDKSR
ncbi:STAS domain-containing protein [bacterium]|nr:STAS domain-containing protein [bacterium]